MGALLLALGLLILVALWPFLVIWAVNTLFGLAIGYSWETWLAAFVLLLVVSVKPTPRKNS